MTENKNEIFQFLHYSLHILEIQNYCETKSFIF